MGGVGGCGSFLRFLEESLSLDSREGGRFLRCFCIGHCGGILRGGRDGEGEARLRLRLRLRLLVFLKVY